MSIPDRRTAERRRAWGRGPTILRFEPLEGRPLMSGAAPDIVAVNFGTVHNLDWGDAFQAVGTLENVGAGDATSAFKVDVYAMGSRSTGSDAVRIGSINIPAGLQAGASTGFDQLLRLPPTAVPGMDGTSTVYLTLKVDPTDALAESNEANNQGLGQGVDTSAVVIVPHQSPSLFGAGFTVQTPNPTWGGSFTVAGKVRNDSQADAPATRARIVLTPVVAGISPGGPADVTIGSIDVPALPRGQSAQVGGTFTLPASAPSTLAGAPSYLVTMVQDADGAAEPVGPHVANRGAGLDSATIKIAANPVALPTPEPLPDLVAGTLQVPATVTWGQTAQLTGTVNNAGDGAAAPSRVRFLLVNADGTTSNTLELAEVSMPAIAARTSQPFTQLVSLPGRAPDTLGLPAGAGLRIVMQVDPENVLDESNAVNNASTSAPIALGLFNPDATTLAPPSPAPTPVLGTPVAISIMPATKPATPAAPAPAGSKPSPAKQTAAAHAAEVRAQLAAAKAARLEAAARKRANILKLRQDAKILRNSPKTPA